MKILDLIFNWFFESFNVSNYFHVPLIFFHIYLPSPPIQLYVLLKILFLTCQVQVVLPIYSCLCDFPLEGGWPIKYYTLKKS